MKKFFSALFVVLFASTMMAQTGLTCNDPIVVDSNYVGTIPAEGEYWFTAGTYDLPLNFHFRPVSDNCLFSPELSIDFTCVPGVYADKKLDSVIQSVSAWDISMPIEFMCDQSKIDGKYVYDLSIDKRYREQLAESGITYNVPAYVKVYFPEAGEIRFRPDTAFTACMNNAYIVALGDTIDILPNDSDRIFLMPFPEWKQDSIRFVWTGEDGARVWLAMQECEFIPSTQSGYVWNYYDVTKDAALKLMPAQIEAAIKENKEGGLFYSKILSTAAGRLVVEKVPVTPPAGGAVLLQYGKSVHVDANATTLFAIPKTWEKATMFVPNSACNLKTQFCINHLFEEKNITTYSATEFDGEYATYITSAELSSLIRSREGDYLYVRFVVDKAIDITPVIWENVSPCLDKSYTITPNESMAVGKSSSNNYYRLRYTDYQGYDLTIKWTGSSFLEAYIGDTCQFAFSTSNKHVVTNKDIDRKSSVVIPAATVDTWANRVDEDGCLYVRLSISGNGNITFQTEKPTPVISPCVLASTLLEPSAALTINLDKAFDIYRIDYQAWLASGVKLVWTGASPLHTFVAKDCEFAVAIYHKDVVNYTEVPAEGNVILSKDILATLGQYVDEDGYLYIRFLTELEGILTTAKAE